MWGSWYETLKQSELVGSWCEGADMRHSGSQNWSGADVINAQKWVKKVHCTYFRSSSWCDRELRRNSCFTWEQRRDSGCYRYSQSLHFRNSGKWINLLWEGTARSAEIFYNKPSRIVRRKFLNPNMSCILYHRKLVKLKFCALECVFRSKNNYIAVYLENFPCGAQNTILPFF